MSFSSFRVEEAEAEAALWLARLHADTQSADDAAAFRRWIDAAPENAEAFRHLTAVWDAVGGVANVRSVREQGGSPLATRRAVLAGVGAVVATGIGLGGWQRAQAGVYQTGLGEQKNVVADDGSLVFLDTDTRIKLHFTDDVRRVALLRGRANFRVAADQDRPFIVESDEQRVVTSRATFDVRRDQDRLSVVLIEGQAMVETQGAAATPGTALREGDRMIVGAALPGRIDRPDIAQVQAWQNGQMIADDQRLAAVVGEMNRYSQAKLFVADTQVADMRISGVYRVGDNAGFARAVTKLLPIGVRSHPNGLELFLLPASSEGHPEI